MALAKPDLRDIDWTLDGLLNAGGRLYTYAAGTSTPLATYADADGTPNSNPIVWDSSGGGQQVWLTVDSSYKFVFCTPEDVVMETIDDFVISSSSGGGGGGGGTTEARPGPIVLTYPGGPPTASEWLGGERIERAMDFAANFSGSYGKQPKHLPGASFVVTIKVSGVTVGTATCSTGGAWSFASTGGSAYSFVAGDDFDFYGPASPDTNIGDFGLTLAPV